MNYLTPPCVNGEDGPAASPVMIIWILEDRSLYSAIQSMQSLQQLVSAEATQSMAGGEVCCETAESKSRVQKGRKSYFAIVCTIAM